MSRSARGAGLVVLAAVILALPSICCPALLQAAAAQAATEADARAPAHAEEARRLDAPLARVRRLHEAGLEPGLKPGLKPGLAEAARAPEPVAAAARASPPPVPTRLAMAPSHLVPSGQAGLIAPAAAGEAELAPRRLQDMRVTVLMRLAPGRYGIRRGSQAADPILCLPDGCYISEGSEREARFLPGRRALGFGNTWGARAGACRGQLLCVFRGVDLGRLPGYVQPIDLHILKHDLRQGLVVPTDSACRLNGRDLVCHAGVYAEDYALWIVPEDLAAAAGSIALRRALFEGLGEGAFLATERPRP